VLDTGKVEGIPLSTLQKDHLLVCLEDCIRRFRPSVPHDLVKVAFVPVVNNLQDLIDYDEKQAE